MLDDATLLCLSDLNLAEATREHARFRAPHAIEEGGGLLLSASATRAPLAPLNAAIGLGDGPLSPERLWSRAHAFFAPRDRGFGVYVRAHRDRALLEDCQRRGLPQAGNSPGMVLTEAPAAPTLASDARLVQVGGNEVEGFVQVSAAAYESLGMAAKVTRVVFAEPARFLVPHWHLRVVMEGERACAAAMLLFSHGIAGIYWVGTAPDARGRGYGEAVTRAISRDAFERGAQAVVLQASAYGEPIYRRIGFRELTRYPWFVVPRGSF